jgi:hypothetical protein
MDTNDYLLIGVLCVFILLPIVCITGAMIYGCLCKQSNNDNLVDKTNYIENKLDDYVEINVK